MGLIGLMSEPTGTASGRPGGGDRRTGRPMPTRVLARVRAVSLPVALNPGAPATGR